MDMSTCVDCGEEYERVVRPGPVPTRCPSCTLPRQRGPLTKICPGCGKEHGRTGTRGPIPDRCPDCVTKRGPRRSVCCDCGTEWFQEKAGRPSLRCPTCRLEHYRRVGRESYTPRVQDSRACGHCAAEFIPTQPWQRFCSPVCADRRSIHPKIVDRFDRAEVFERDGWKCHICGEPVAQGADGRKHPMAPTLDHIIPIALGGEHSYLNTACAHRICNIRKSTHLLTDAERTRIRSLYEGDCLVLVLLTA